MNHKEFKYKNQKEINEKVKAIETKIETIIDKIYKAEEKQKVKIYKKEMAFFIFNNTELEESINEETLIEIVKIYFKMITDKTNISIQELVRLQVLLNNNENRVSKEIMTRFDSAKYAIYNVASKKYLENTKPSAENLFTYPETINSIIEDMLQKYQKITRLSGQNINALIRFHNRYKDTSDSNKKIICTQLGIDSYDELVELINFIKNNPNVIPALFTITYLQSYDLGLELNIKENSDSYRR